MSLHKNNSMNRTHESNPGKRLSSSSDDDSPNKVPRLSRDHIWKRGMPQTYQRNGFDLNIATSKSTNGTRPRNVLACIADFLEHEESSSDPTTVTSTSQNYVTPQTSVIDRISEANKISSTSKLMPDESSEVGTLTNASNVLEDKSKKPSDPMDVPVTAQPSIINRFPGNIDNASSSKLTVNQPAEIVTPVNMINVSKDGETNFVDPINSFNSHAQSLPPPLLSSVNTLPQENNVPPKLMLIIGKPTKIRTSASVTFEHLLNLIAAKHDDLAESLSEASSSISDLLDDDDDDDDEIQILSDSDSSAPVPVIPDKQMEKTGNVPEESVNSTSDGDEHELVLDFENERSIPIPDIHETQMGKNVIEESAISPSDVNESVLLLSDSENDNTAGQHVTDIPVQTSQKQPVTTILLDDSVIDLCSDSEEDDGEENPIARNVAEVITPSIIEDSSRKEIESSTQLLGELMNINVQLGNNITAPPNESASAESVPPKETEDVETAHQIEPPTLANKESEDIGMTEEVTQPIRESVVSVNAIAQSADNAQHEGIERTVKHVIKLTNPMPQLSLREMKDSLSYFLGKTYPNFILRAPEEVDSGSSIPFNATKSFRILSYNVLCQATMEDFLYIDDNKPNPAFKWIYRWKLLSNELKNFDADICCLQEVEKSKEPMFYKPLIDEKRWESFYTWREGDKQDGCAIFWNPKMFIQLESIAVRLNHEVPNVDKPNVAQIVRFKHNQTGKELIVVNTHLVYDPNNGLKKLLQLSIIFANLHKIRTKNQPIIFCGDFNFEPMSQLFEFVINGEIDALKPPCYICKMSGQRKKRIKGSDAIAEFFIPKKLNIKNNCVFANNEEETESATTSVKHEFNFESVYDHSNVVSSSYLVDQKGNGIVSNTDFMFYSVKHKVNIKKTIKNVTESDLFLHKRLSLPDLQKLKMPMPNQYTGSSHLPLYAVFCFP